MIDDALDNSSYTWSRHDPHALQLQEFVSTHSVMWPHWDWRGVIEAGRLSRERNDPVQQAIESVGVQFNLGANSRILILAWLTTGLLTMVKPTENSGEADTSSNE